MSIDAKTLKHPYAWIALGFGSGLSPKAPGTAGSLLAVMLWWLLFADLALRFGDERTEIAATHVARDRDPPLAPFARDRRRARDFLNRRQT